MSGTRVYITGAGAGGAPVHQPLLIRQLRCSASDAVGEALVRQPVELHGSVFSTVRSGEKGRAGGVAARRGKVAGVLVGYLVTRALAQVWERDIQCVFGLFFRNQAQN